jgi:hypothetical protein
VKLRRRCQGGNHVAMAGRGEPAAWAAGAWSTGGVVCVCNSTVLSVMQQ